MGCDRLHKLVRADNMVSLESLFGDSRLVQYLQHVMLQATGGMLPSGDETGWAGQDRDRKLYFNLLNIKDYLDMARHVL